MSDKQIVILRPSPGTVIDGLNIVGNGGAGTPDQQYGIYINCYPAPSDPTYICKGLVIKNCNVTGFNVNVCVIGPNVGTQIYGNVIADATGTDQTMTSGGHCHGLYTEGLQQGSVIHDNVIRNNGWWPNAATAGPVINMNHGWYNNQAAGSDDTTQFFNNVVIDNCGSNVGCRQSLRAWNNVFRGTSDWDLIVGQYGKDPAAIFANACFAPRKDAVPYYGGGIHLLCPGQVAGNLYSNTAGITYNPAALSEPGGVVQPQIGVWPKPGCTTRPVGSKVPTLEDFCLATYGVADVSALKPGDAPKIIAWLANQLVTPVTPTPPINPAPIPAPFPITLTIDPMKQTAVQVPNASPGASK